MFRHALLLGFATLSLSQAGNIIRLCHTDAITITFYRLLIASLLVLPWTVRELPRQLPKVRARTLVIVALMAIAFSAHFLAWITAVQKTKVADAAICFSFSPVFTAIGARLFLKERISWQTGVAIGAGIIGLALVSGSDLSLSSQYFQGDLFALLAGGLFSIHCLLGKALRDTLPNLLLMPLVYFFGTVLALAAVLLTDAPLTQFDTSTWIGFIGLALFPTILGHASVIYVMKYFRASLVSTVLLLEPVFAGIVAYLAFGETLTPWGVAGYLFICSGLLPLFYEGNLKRKACIPIQTNI